MAAPLLDIKNLAIAFKDGKTWNKVIHGISFALHKNEILGIVGESGSGKSISTLAILGLLPDNAAVKSGQIRFDDRDLRSFSNKQFRNIRGKEIAMIFQEPMSSLNPSMKCGKQVREILKQHTDLRPSAIKKEVLRLFEQVQLPRPASIAGSYPHQISGGQKQRVMIAIAIACKPKILIADEPTTALDVTVQQEILELLKSIQRETDMSIIFISHDLALVSEIADRVAVMYQGDIVEQNQAREVFLAPEETYTKALLASKPVTDKRLKTLPTVSQFLSNSVSNAVETREERQQRHHNIYNADPILEVDNMSKVFSLSKLFNKGEKTQAVKNVSFKIYEGETLGLVGESGCGKSTLGNLILNLLPPTSGTARYRGKTISQLSESDFRRYRREIQLIFQDPFSSLNPRIPIGEAIMEPMRVHELYTSKQQRREKALELLEQVGLEAQHFKRYPHEFSGGQRQRIGIARTIAVEPKFIICDESVSALDISVQAQVLNLLNDLKAKYGFTYLFIAHDLAVVKYMADNLLVMNKGEIVERGEADTIYNNPQQAYTQKLIGAIPKGIESF